MLNYQKNVMSFEQERDYHINNYYQKTDLYKSNLEKATKEAQTKYANDLLALKPQATPQAYDDYLKQEDSIIKEYTDDILQGYQKTDEQTMNFFKEQRELTPAKLAQKAKEKALAYNKKVADINQKAETYAKNRDESINKINRIDEIDEKIKPQLEAGQMDETFHKELLREASTKDLGEGAGFFQKRAQNQLKPGTRENQKSIGIQSRHLVLGGGALAGGIFGNRKRDHSRGFNSHRGSRI